MAVKSKVAQVRKAAGLTQSELASGAHISRQAYSAIEAGKSIPSTEVSLRLARVLHVSVDELFSLDDDSEHTVRAELVGDDGVLPVGAPLQLMRVGPRLLARSLRRGAGVSHTFNLADARAVGVTGSEVDLTVLNNDATTASTLVLSGCDPSTSILANLMRDLGVRLIWLDQESIPSLRALARGEVHVAGCSFRDSVTGIYNSPLVKEIVPFPCTMVRFAVWSQGIVVSAGNPKSIGHVDDLARPYITIINGASGAGSRGLLTRLLRGAGIPPAKVHGYDSVANGYLAGAERVAAGLADCSIGIEAAARANDLGFLPLIEEPYDLVIPNHFLDLPSVRLLLDLLRTPRLRLQVEALGGYDTRSMGSPVG